MVNINMEGTGVKHTEQLEMFDTSVLLSEEQEGKVCPKCKKLKPLEFFPWKSGQKIFRRENCRACENYLNKVRNILRNKHGMPPDNYSCPICKGTVINLGKAGGQNAEFWALDHCHKSEEFRGWLCHLCNRALGCFKDDIKILERAIEYLTGGKQSETH